VSVFQQTRDTFCGTWYLIHSQVRNDRTVPIIIVGCNKSNFIDDLSIVYMFHCACAKPP